MFTWNVFIQIETVALKAVGLPEEGTLRIGGRRERLRTIPSLPPYLRTIKYRPYGEGAAPFLAPHGRTLPSGREGTPLG